MGNAWLRVFVDGRAMDDMWFTADVDSIKEHGWNTAKFLYNLMENGILANFEVTAFIEASREIIEKYTPESIEEIDGYDQEYT